MPQQSKRAARAQQMFALIQKYLTSNLTQRAFCQQERLAYPTFHYWLRKYRGHQRSITSPQTVRRQEFIAIAVRPSLPTAQLASSCVLEYPSGLVVHLSGPVEAVLLAQLIGVTERSS